MKHHTNFISIKYILNRLLKDEPYINEINLGDAVEWVGDAINRLGSNSLYAMSICEIPIINCKGVLPSNFKDIEAIRDTKTGLGLNETHNKFPSSQSEHTDIINSLEYDIKDKIIYVEFETGTIEILFKGYKLDNDGLPQVPDMQRVIDYIYWNIAYKIAYPLWAMGKMSDKVYTHIHQQKLFHGAAARLKLKIPDKKQMQTIVNQSMQIVPNQQLYQDNFVNIRNVNSLKFV